MAGEPGGDSGHHDPRRAMGQSCRTHTFGADGIDERGDDLEQVSELLQRTGAIVWVDLDDPSPDDLTMLAAELGLHQLSVEDALEAHQRDKYVHYDHHVFLVCHAIALDVEHAASTSSSSTSSSDHAGWSRSTAAVDR